MALTPEVVVNKKFQVTKFREGYDQDEVDDFLDEIVEELRRLNQENDELRRQVAELETQTGEATPVPAPVPADGGDEDATAADLPVVEAEPEVEEAAVEAEPEIVEPVAPEEPVAAAVPAEASHETTAESAAGVLAMAQRLHDEYVAEGERKRDEIVGEAEREANRLVTEAQETSRKTLEDFEKRKTTLEREVEELRGFERDYRSRLRSFIENQLQDLDSQARVTE